MRPTIKPAYQPEQKRLRKRVDYLYSGGNWSVSSESRYLYDGLLLVQERDSSNRPRVTYTRGRDLSGSADGAGGIGGLLARSTHSTSSPYPMNGHAFYHADGNGNITALVNASGVLQANYRYDPFGRTLSSSGTLANGNTLRFSSKPVVVTPYTQFGMYYYGYRFYDPLTQRWLNRDPIEEDGGDNLYAFINNRPLDLHDPFGQAPRGGGHHHALHALYRKLIAVGGGPGAEVIGEWMSDYDPAVHKDARRHMQYVHAVFDEARFYLGSLDEQNLRRLAKDPSLATRFCIRLMESDNPIIKEFMRAVTIGGRATAGGDLAIAVAKVSKKFGPLLAIGFAVTGVNASADSFTNGIFNYGNAILENDDPKITLSAVEIAIEFQNMTGNIFATYKLLDELLEP